MTFTLPRSTALGFAFTALATLSGAGAAFASEHGAPAEHGAAPAAAEEAATERIDILNLGDFRLRSTRTTDREITDIKFAVQLVLSTSTTEVEHRELKQWTERLRDQALTAVRGAAPADFLDPKLHRLQRIMLFRVKRLPIGDKIIGVYLTDFSLDYGENVSELFTPAIIPPAPAKKKPAGGH